MVGIKNLFKSYNQKKVIDDVSVEIEKGTITSFIGPNGAGKSTLISMVSRLIEKDEGTITIDGQDIMESKSNELAKKISILKQSNEIKMKLTVRELVSFGRFPYSQGRLKSEDWNKVDEASDYMELRYMQHKYLDGLSGGDRKSTRLNSSHVAISYAV